MMAVAENKRPREEEEGTVATTAGHGVPPEVLPRHFAFYTRRYYTTYVIRDAKGTPGNNIRLMLHSNGVLVVALDPSHILVQQHRRGDTTTFVPAPPWPHRAAPKDDAPADEAAPPTAADTQADEAQGKEEGAAVQEREPVPIVCTSVSFSGGRCKKDRSDNQENIKGKRKKQALWMQADTILALVTANDGAVYKVPCCVNGSLFELNTRLKDHPSLLLSSPTTAGFIGVLNPRQAHLRQGILETVPGAELVENRACTDTDATD